MENKTLSQAAKFTAVGIINTLIDFTVLNILLAVGFTASFILFGQEFIVANIISVSVAVINSFVLNRFWAFGSTKEKTNIWNEIWKFLIITFIGMFVIHQIIFNVLYSSTPWLMDFFYSIIRVIRLDSVFSFEFVRINSAKVIATIASLVWNFVGYKFFVFKK
ncbi:MAG: GtrA family protein [Candidatus Colwellbacteria bacterium]|nr:GtrA family protein [Candidatus Colwellbacteria bacterium]